jgi:hypothetical protein
MYQPTRSMLTPSMDIQYCINSVSEISKVASNLGVLSVRFGKLVLGNGFGREIVIVFHNNCPVRLCEDLAIECNFHFNSSLSKVLGRS